MATKTARGIKRTCQSNECGARFYDLNRNPIVCPVCGSLYELATGPISGAAAAEEKAARRKKPEIVEQAAEVSADGDEALPDIEEGGEEIAADGDETFLEEEEEEGGDVSNLVGPVAEGGEEER